MRQHIAGSFLVLLLAAGCSTLSTDPASRQVGVDGEACVGSIDPTPSALTQVTSRALLSHAQLASGKGGTCLAKSVSVATPLVLYRVFDSANPHSKFGSWWALSRPTGTKENYRMAYAICPEWSNLDRFVSCEVRPGTELVIGTTQSTFCADGSMLPKTKELQVFVPNDGRAGIYHVGACADEAPWP